MWMKICLVCELLIVVIIKVFDFIELNQYLIKLIYNSNEIKLIYLKFIILI